MKTLFFLCMLFLLNVTACAPKNESTDSSSVDESQTKEILEHHLKAFQQNDMEEMMADYTEESILVIPNGTFSGLSEIRKNFEVAFAMFPKDSTTMEVDKTVIKKDVAYILWKAKTPKFELTYGTDTFIIRDRKIVRQTYAGVAK